VNHDADNVIKFTPQAIGQFKIMIQEPEMEVLQINDEGYDIEVAIYDPELG